MGRPALRSLRKKARKYLMVIKAENTHQQDLSDPSSLINDVPLVGFVTAALDDTKDRPKGTCENQQAGNIKSEL